MKIEGNKYIFENDESADIGGILNCYSSIDAPSDEEKNEFEDELGNDWRLLDCEMMTKPQEKLADVISRKEDFIVYGGIGWGKSAAVKDCAHKLGFTAITIYLDGAGAPRRGRARHEDVSDLMPGWAVYMMEHPEVNFLLYFDHTNGAYPRALNALESIIRTKTIRGVKFDNFFVGASGDYASEIDGANAIKELPESLKSCLIEIDWESHSEEAWAAHFAWAHKNWDDKCGKELIDKCEELKEYWDSPETVTRFIYKWVANANEDYLMLCDPEFVAEDLMDNAVYDKADKDSPKLKEKIKEFAEWEYNYIERRLAK